MAKPKYTARDALLSLTDQSNWPVGMKDRERDGYAEAMGYVHETVMEFWDELTAKELAQ